jgi:hypothetical protein
VIQFAAVLLRGVIATFTGLLIAGGTLTLAADRAAPQRPTLVAVPPSPKLLTVPQVTGQAYVFAKGILEDGGFAWHVSGPVLGYAANTVAEQQPAAGTVVLDTGAPTVTLALARNPSYVERGTPENDASYAATAIRIPANVPKRPQTAVEPTLDPVPAPVSPGVQPNVAAPEQATAPVSPAVTIPVAPVTPVQQARTPKPTVKPAPTAKVPTGLRPPDFVVSGAPKEPAGSKSLPDRVVALAVWIQSHRSPSPANLNHWLYEHAYVVAGARFGWWHGADALQGLIAADKRAEALWAVGAQSRMTAEKALVEVRSRGA